MDACWKDALRARPEGSFLFPENVVVDELLEHIDNTWATRWEGFPRLERTSTSASSTTSDDDRMKKGSWVKKALQKMKLWRRKREVDVELSSDSLDDFNSFIPRFPDWADWSNEDCDECH